MGKSLKRKVYDPVLYVVPETEEKFSGRKRLDEWKRRTGYITRQLGKYVVKQEFPDVIYVKTRIDLEIIAKEQDLFADIN